MHLFEEFEKKTLVMNFNFCVIKTTLSCNIYKT
jgi:hypothetical protein